MGNNKTNFGNKKPEPEMTLTPLKDGGCMITDLSLGDRNTRYWQYDEKGVIVWRAYPEPFAIPDEVTVISQLRCPILGEVIVPPSVKEIDELAFGREFYTGDTYEWNALHTIHFSQGLERIGYRAFCNCKFLDGVHLPKGLLEIAEGAFFLCLSLSRITIPESVEHLGYQAFGKCYSLKKVIFRDGIRRFAGSVFCEDRSLSEVILPQTLERIGRDCFYNCVALREIDIPENLSELGAYAFRGCEGLTSFHFKRDLSNAEEMHKETPFEGCSSLKEYYLDYGVTRADWLPSAPALISINVPADHPLFTAIDGVLYSKDKRTLLRVPTGYAGEFILPRGVYTIAPNAFRNCSKITEVILPSSLQKIDTGAFLGCSSLRSVNFPGRLTEVGDKAFEGCTELARVHISSSVQRIGEGTFAGCPALRDISISPENKAYRLEGEKIMPACD